MAQTRPVPRSFVGTVVSNKMQKTVVVEVIRLERHGLYGKVVRRKTKLKAHDENNHCQMGDQVTIIHTRPTSKDKHWRVSSINSKKG